MKRVVCCGLLTIVLSLVAPSVSAQTPQRQNVGRDTWYEFLLKQFNPSNFDYGAWLEKRREAFLEATVKEPYFWYSLSVTAGTLLLMGAYAKLYLDHLRSMRVTTEMMADVYSHDLLARQAAAEAIEKYNRHIEQCNRAIEASEAGDARPGWGDTQVDSLKAELQRVAGQLEATTQEVNGPQEDGSRAGESVSTDATAGGTRFVGHINRLQEELYTERQKNKRLKGA